MADFVHFLSFLASRAETFYGDSRDYYLSISVNKSLFRTLFVIFDLFWAWPNVSNFSDPLKHMLYTAE